MCLGNLSVRPCSCPHKIKKISRKWHKIQHILQKNSILYADQNTEIKGPNTAQMIIVFLFSLCQVEAQHCVWYGECGESEKVPGKKYNCKYTGPAVPLPSEGSDLLTVQTLSWCFSSCYCRYLTFKTMTCNTLLLSIVLYFFTLEIFYQTDAIRFVFACRNFVPGMTMETEASAATLTSCAHSKGASSCPFSSCLGMHCFYNKLMKYMTCWEGHYHSPT